MVSDLLFHILILIDGNCFIILKVLLYLIYLHKKNPFGFFFFVFFVFFCFFFPSPNHTAHRIHHHSSLALPTRIVVATYCLHYYRAHCIA